VDQARATGRARRGHVGRSLTVDRKGKVRFCLGAVDRVVGGAVEDNFGPAIANETVNRLSVGD